MNLKTGFETKKKRGGGSRYIEKRRTKWQGGETCREQARGGKRRETDLPFFGIKERQLGRLLFIADTKIVFTIQPVRTKCFDPQLVLLDQLVIRIKREVV